jgi:uncharacterized membrane protein YoaK (UPF0700 family)
MPLVYLRRLTGKDRSAKANRHLALFLAFIAGATNAGGFLAVHQYTSHMTGIVSAMADNLALGEVGLLLTGLGALLSFLLGAACTAILVNWGRRREFHSEYALPLLVEAALLLLFGLVGSHLGTRHYLFVPATVTLLCFTMGLQNAIITKISKAVIRTTHITGMVTDVGIELGKLFYWNHKFANPHEHLEEHPLHHPVHADTQKLSILLSLIGLFFLGGVIGAIGFKHLGFISALPLAATLIVLAVLPVWDDLRHRKTAHPPSPTHPA